VLSACVVPSSYKEDNCSNQVSSVWEYVKKSVSWKGATIQAGLSTEAEESPLLEAVTRKRLMKPAGRKCLACAVVICKV
jgi:hypothetical protein